AGVWGSLAVGIFGQPEVLGTIPIFGRQFLAQFIGVSACGVWAFGLALIGFWILNKVVPLRVSSEDEDKGLNIVEHGASTEIFDVYAKMKEQAVTGDLSVRLPVEPFTEIGQISSLYNDVMQKLEESSLSEESFGALMKSIPYALFMIDAQWNINPQYSESTPRILGCPNPENYNFLLLMARILPRDKTQSLKKYLENLYSPDFKQAAVETLNPIQSLTLSVRTHELEPKIVQKVIHFEFSRIFNKQKTKVLHVIVQAK
ncbi:MAG: ammonium transporter, partial [Spirochaetaceae bacterium]|nr:ammonium transporter [Spirochaetaceae bacterium]